MPAVPLCGRLSSSISNRPPALQAITRIEFSIRFVFFRHCLTALELPRHSWMLDVAKKMLGCRAGAGFCDDNAIAQLRRQLEYRAPVSYRDADNPDPVADLRAGSIERGRLYAGDYRRDSSDVQ